MPKLSFEQAEQLVQGHHWDPLSILGPHPATTSDPKETNGLAIRCFLPEAKEVAVVLDAKDFKPVPMRRIHKAGLFEALCPTNAAGTSYRLRITDHAGHVSERHDPYAFAPLL